MRRFIAAAVITAALASLAVMAGRVQADEAPDQATATRRFISTDTPGPSPTQGPPTATWVTRTPGPPDCPPLDTYCHSAYLPVMSRDPSPTPMPTATATDGPEIICRELVPDGSFEMDPKDSPWRSAGTGTAGFAEAQNGIKPVRGAHMAAIEADTSKSIRIFSPKAQGIWAGLVKATFKYAWNGISSDIEDHADVLIGSVVDRDDSTDNWSAGGELTFNEDIDGRWHFVESDVTAWLNTGHQQIQAEFWAKNDNGFTTAWYIDAVSLEVCAHE